MRCCAHILNLIVSSGLKEIDNSVLRIRVAVKYIRSSPSRFMKFKECVERQKIEYKCHICLDVETRWNSTYLMLDVALKRKMAFAELEFYDTSFNLWLYYFFLFNLVPIFVIFVQFSPYIRYFCLI